MTTFATTAAPDNSTDAAFRAWINVFHSVLTATGGWVQTADTGQINYATVTRPLAANTKQGYALYAMNDSLQSTKPIILKLGFGSGSNALFPGVWFAIGTATDGAGNFIDTNDSNRAALLVDQFSQTAPAMLSIASAAGALDCFGSVGTNYMVVCMFEPAQPTLQYNAGASTWQVQTNDHTGAPANFPMLFSIERARDSAGVVLGTHALVQWTGQATAAKLNNSHYFPTSHDLPNRPVQQGLACYQLWYGTKTQEVSHIGNVADDGSPGVYISGAPVTGIVPFLENTEPAPPGIGVLVSRWPHFEYNYPVAPVAGGTTCTYKTGATVAVSPYGASHTYRSVSGVRAAYQSTQDSFAYLMIRYE